VSLKAVDLKVFIVKKSFLFIILIVSFVFSVFGNDSISGLKFVSQNVDYNLSNSIDRGADYLRGWNDLTPIVSAFVNSDGSVSVCSAAAATTYVYEYSKDLALLRTMRFNNELNKFGAFTKDSEGNYYFFYGRDVAENERNVINMILVKYNRSGAKVNTYSLNAYAENSYNGIKEPFSAGSCRMEISGNMLCVYFARKKFASPNDGLNHQSSYGFILNKDTFRRVDAGQVINNSYKVNGAFIPYVSHSFNQFLLPIRDGFLFADKGDMYPRAFSFGKFVTGRQSIDGKTAFSFKKSSTYQYTFAQLGGAAQTANGFIFTGTYEKNNTVSNVSHNDSRNIFILTMDNELNNISNPIWITDYNDRERFNAANPKITALDTGRYLLMWEQMSRNSYISTYMVIIDANGNRLAQIREIGNVRLNINDTLRYNSATGTVFWAVNSGNNSIITYSFDPGSSSRPAAERTSNERIENETKAPSEKNDNDTKLSDVLGFEGSIGFYLNGWNQNLLSLGVPVQLGLKVKFNKMALNFLAEGGVGLGVLSLSEFKLPLLEWNYGGIVEFYFPGEIIGLGLGGGMADSFAIKYLVLPSSEPFKEFYMRFTLIFNFNTKYVLYAQLYGDLNWGFGIMIR